PAPWIVQRSLKILATTSGSAGRVPSRSSGTNTAPLWRTVRRNVLGRHPGGGLAERVEIRSWVLSVRPLVLVGTAGAQRVVSVRIIDESHVRVRGGEPVHARIASPWDADNHVVRERVGGRAVDVESRRALRVVRPDHALLAPLRHVVSIGEVLVLVFWSGGVSEECRRGITGRCHTGRVVLNGQAQDGEAGKGVPGAVDHLEDSAVPSPVRPEVIEEVVLDQDSRGLLALGRRRGDSDALVVGATDVHSARRMPHDVEAKRNIPHDRPRRCSIVVPRGEEDRKATNGVGPVVLEDVSLDEHALAVVHLEEVFHWPVRAGARTPRHGLARTPGYRLEEVVMAHL